MANYSEFIERLFLREELLSELQPSEPADRELLRRLRASDDQALSGGKTIGNREMFSLVRGGLFYALDALDDCHALFQEAKSDEGSYWHGMMHRREGDFDNARYWFRRAGTLPVFNAMHRTATEVSPTMGKQNNWDAYLLTGQCEQARFGAEELEPELLKLQRVEFDVLFDYCWRKSALT
jgi:hypothetical protein